MLQGEASGSDGHCQLDHYVATVTFECPALAWVYLRLYTHTHTHIHTHTHTEMHAHTHIHLQTHTCTYMRKHTYTAIHDSHLDHVLFLSVYQVVWVKQGTNFTNLKQSFIYDDLSFIDSSCITIGLNEIHSTYTQKQSNSIYRGDVLLSSLNKTTLVKDRKI